MRRFRSPAIFMLALFVAAVAAQEREPRTTEEFNDRGIARKAKGDLDGAIADYDRAISLNPTYALAYYNRGIARGDKGDLNGAIADYTKAVELNPDYVSAYYNRGNVRRERGELDEAVADYTKASALNPSDAKA